MLFLLFIYRDIIHAQPRYLMKIHHYNVFIIIIIKKVVYGAKIDRLTPGGAETKFTGRRSKLNRTSSALLTLADHGETSSRSDLLQKTGRRRYVWTYFIPHGVQRCRFCRSWIFFYRRLARDNVSCRANGHSMGFIETVLAAALAFKCLSPGRYDVTVSQNITSVY